jgi:chemotaxis family two-component system sensor kinase Cph1
MQIKNLDSEICGKVPIHLTNQIQAYGALMVIDATTLEVIQVSENISKIFQRPFEEIVNTPLSDYLSSDAIEEISTNFTTDQAERLPAAWTIGGVEYLALLHRKNDCLLAELDLNPLVPAKEDSFSQMYQKLRVSMASIESASDLKETCSVATRELKRMSGFDKVMIYQFDEEWNGTVLAEEAEPSMERYLNLTFPSSDIPPQARKLYLKNPYRYIPDRTYEPVSLYPVINPLTNSFTDLTDCNLRSVAGVHLEYLKNMGVTASMSTRIMHHDKLWGLIACHHKTAKSIDFKTCSMFEMFSRIISMKISSLQNQALLNAETTLTTNYSQLIESIYKSRDLDSELLKNSGALRLFNASGAVVTRRGKYLTAGTVPATDHLDELVLWLHTREPKRVFHTFSLVNEYEYASEYQDIASGMLVIPINYLKDEYVIVFRPEKIYEINWGGNPDERIQFESDQKNYHPRSSFRQWQEEVRGMSTEWTPAELRFAETLRSFIYEYETSGTH